MTGQQTIERAQQIVSEPGNAVAAKAFIAAMYASWKHGNSYVTSGEAGWRTNGDVKFRTGQVYVMLKRYIETDGPQTLTPALRDELAKFAVKA